MRRSGETMPILSGNILFRRSLFSNKQADLFLFSWRSPQCRYVLQFLNKWSKSSPRWWGHNPELFLVFRGCSWGPPPVHYIEEGWGSSSMPSEWLYHLKEGRPCVP